MLRASHRDGIAMHAATDAHEPFRPDFSEGVEIGLYLALLELVDQGILIVSDEQILEANSAACQLLERPYRALIKAPLESLFPTPQAFLRARARWFIQNETRGSIALALSNGQTRHFRFTAAARIRPGIHALLLAPDEVAEQYQQLSLAETFWVHLATVVAEPIWVTDNEERLVATNPAGRRLLPEGSTPPLPLASFAVVRWPESSQVTQAIVEGHWQMPLVATILHGPKPGWRLLVLPRAHKSRSVATRPAAPTPHSEPADSLAQQLAQAKSDEMVLTIAPCLDVVTGQLAGAEALLTWHHPVLGPLSWQQVAPLLSDARANRAWLMGLLTHATAWVSRWRRPLALNLDERQLHHSETLPLIRNAWQHAGLPWHTLQLEIDEPAFARLDTDQCAALLALGEKGVRVVVDNIGRAACALGLLAHLPVQAIKIAAEWVTAIGRDERAERLIDGLMHFGQALGLRVMAHGVTTPAQRDFLAALGCTLQQGPIFGPLVAADQPLHLQRTAAQLPTQPPPSPDGLPSNQ